jgi:hypothetical protein
MVLLPSAPGSAQSLKNHSNSSLETFRPINQNASQLVSRHEEVWANQHETFRT